MNQFFKSILLIIIVILSSNIISYKTDLFYFSGASFMIGYWSSVIVTEILRNKGN